jgi:sulfur carrier protein
MQLKINGETYSPSGSGSISALLSELGIDPSGVAAVEVNMEIIRKKDFDSTALRDGDRVEIVNFVGGG